jgi:hypothetical protein
LHPAARCALPGTGATGDARSEVGRTR